MMRRVEQFFLFVVAGFMSVATSAQQTTVTNNNDGSINTVPVYTGSATLANSPITVSGNKLAFFYSTNTSYLYPYLAFNRAEGTATQPQSVQGGDYTGGTNFYGYYNGVYVGTASLNSMDNIFWAKCSFMSTMEQAQGRIMTHSTLRPRAHIFRLMSALA